MRHIGNQPHKTDDAGRNEHHIGVGEQLPQHLLAHIFVIRDAGYHHARSGRDDQRRDLSYQAVTNSEDGIDLGCLTKGEVVLSNSHNQAADNVDHHDQQASDGVASHELTSTVHGAVELGFLPHFLAAHAGFIFTDQTSVEVGVNGHLLAGHGVQGEARTHFGDPPGALGNHHKVDDDQDDEDDQTDREIATNQEVTERLNHFTGGVRASRAVHQHHAR